MNSNFFGTFGFSGLTNQWGNFIGIIILLSIWALVWKGLALYKAARRGDITWFVVLLLLNTLGIVEILYLYFFSEPKGLLRDKSDTTRSTHHKV